MVHLEREWKLHLPQTLFYISLAFGGDYIVFWIIN
jgi:hypothetical protein